MTQMQLMYPNILINGIMANFVIMLCDSSIAQKTSFPNEDVKDWRRGNYDTPS
jgi:hypothetical protein